MRKYLIAGLLTVAFVTPALAEDFYVAVDLASGRCVMMSGAAPDTKHFKAMGKYGSNGGGAQGHGYHERVPVAAYRSCATIIAGVRLLKAGARF
jgi:acetylornithine deacetylase/succinyl-diaminopimelate desuccinylase-like protein